MHLYSCVHLQYIQVCMCKRVIRACCYKEHLCDICRNMFCIRQYLSKKKKRKEKREKNEKWDLRFIRKSYMYMYMKKSGTLVCYFFVSCDSRVGPTVQTAIFQFFLWYGKDYLKHTL